MNKLSLIKEAAFTYCSENKYKIGAILSVALLGLALGIEINQLALPHPDLPNKETFSILQQRHTAISLPAIISVYITLPLAIGNSIAWGIKYYKQPVSSEPKGKGVFRAAILLGGMALVFVGLGMVTTTAFNKTHNTFAENSAWYSDKQWTCLQDTLNDNLTAGISLMGLGGLIFAGGISLELTNKALGYVVAPLRKLWAYRKFKQRVEDNEPKV